MATKVDRVVDMEDFLNSINYAAKHSGLGIGGIADAVGCAEQTLRNRLNPNDDSHIQRLSDFVMVMKQTSDTAPLEMLCNMFGGRFMSKSQRISESLMHAVLEVMREQGDVSKAIEDALADDNHINDGERAEINRQILEHESALAQLKNTVNKK